MEARTRISATPDTALVFIALAWERIHADDMLINAKPDSVLGAIDDLRIEEVLVDGGLRVSAQVRLPDELLPQAEPPVVDLLGEQPIEPWRPGRVEFVLDFWVGSDKWRQVEVTMRGVAEHDLGPSYHRYAARLQRMAVAAYEVRRS